jgi:hypothetical protein
VRRTVRNRVSLSAARLSFDSQIDSQQGKQQWIVAATVQRESLNLSPVSPTSIFLDLREKVIRQDSQLLQLLPVSERVPLPPNLSELATSPHFLHPTDSRVATHRSGAGLLLRLGFAKVQHHQTDLDFISIFEHVLADALTVHVGAIGAVLITNAIGPCLIACDDGMRPRDSLVVEGNVTLAAATNGHTVLVYFEDLIRLLALAHDQQAETLRSGAWMCTVCAVVLREKGPLSTVCCQKLTGVATEQSVLQCAVLLTFFVPLATLIQRSW